MASREFQLTFTKFKKTASNFDARNKCLARYVPSEVKVGRINIEIPEETHKKVKAISALKGITLIEYINQAIEEKLKRMKQL